MPINTHYNGYDLAVKKSTLVRDFAEGEFSVKAKEEVYLPALGGQDVDDYNAYLERGYLVPAVEPTALAIIGAIMRIDPVFDPTGSIGYLLEDFDGEGNSSTNFVEGIIKQLLYAGSAGYLIEYTDKAIVKEYTKESIINVSPDYIVLMQEYQEQDKKDKFLQYTKKEYLELTYDENGNYIQNIWRQAKGKEFAIVETITPTNRGQSLTRIPFVFSNPLSSDPVLLHLSNINHKQYMQSTDESHGLHWTALPTGFIFGELTDSKGRKKQITVGAGSFNHIDDIDARVELLEFKGAGLTALRASINEKIENMASIGATMLTDSSGGVRSAKTATIEASSQTATLSTIANTVDSVMANILEILAEWMSASVPPFEVNRDFIDSNLDPQSLLAYLQVYQSGGMSLNSFLNLLVKGELLPKSITALQEADRIETTGSDFNGGVDDDEEDQNVQL
tara:strand:+ start:332 stop:1681 length:1350 start_codon:yes stop_codon:yes gene_type:complete